MRNVAILLGLAAIAAEPAHHWSYAGKTGPTHWGQLDGHFKACATGKSQSPIDIRTANVHGAALPALEFHYAPSALHIVDNGHTVQVNVDPGSSLRVGGQRYELVQFHFHHPSE